MQVSTLKDQLHSNILLEKLEKKDHEKNAPPQATTNGLLFKLHLSFKLPL